MTGIRVFDLNIELKIEGRDFMKAMDRLSAHMESRLNDLEKAKRDGQKIIGYTPGGFLPEELVMGCGAIPVGLIRGGDHSMVEFADKYICHWIDTFCRAQIGYGISGKDPYYNLIDLLAVPMTDNHIRAVMDILVTAGLELRFVNDRLRARGPIRFPLSADLSDTPDLFPALAVVAAAAPVGSELTGLQHLKHKESDRLSVMVDNLRRLGAGLIVDGSRVVIETPMRREEHSPPPAVTAAGDHRIAMAMAVAALAAGPLALDDSSCVAKSFPGFWAMWDSLTSSGMG